MINKWDYSGVDEVVYGSFESYEKCAEFLGDTVEDWGCGTGFAKKYFKEYKGIDGSPSKEVRKTVDLVNYTSDVDNILLRQVLEMNTEWRKILENAIKSFRKKLCIVIFTPLVEETKLETSWARVSKEGLSDSEDVIPEIRFNKQDILAYFPEKEFKVKEETLKTSQAYGQDYFIYVERI